MPTHVVKQGEHLTRIAKDYGFLSINPIWDHPDNADLKKRRKNPNVLNPGDKLFIPEKQQKWVDAPTTKVHPFQIIARQLKLILRLKDEGDDPVTNAACTLNVQGKSEAQTTDAEGKLKKMVLPMDVDAMLDINGIEIPIKIGHLDPVTEVTGQQARLNNLGYSAGPLDAKDEKRLRSAVEEFQCDQGIKPVTGVCDKTTQDKLLAAHGC